MQNLSTEIQRGQFWTAGKNNTHQSKRDMFVSFPGKNVEVLNVPVVQNPAAVINIMLELDNYKRKTKLQNFPLVSLRSLTDWKKENHVLNIKREVHSYTENMNNKKGEIKTF